MYLKKGDESLCCVRAIKQNDIVKHLLAFRLYMREINANLYKLDLQ